MQFLRRAIAWSFFLGLLTVVGVPVFLYVRYTPRHIATGRLTIEHLSADGRWLVTSSPHPDFNFWDNPEAPETEQNNQGYLHVWDIHRGRLERVFEIGLPIEMSPDGRQFICCRENGKLLLIDWRTATTSVIAWDEIEKGLNRQFSARGRWLVKGRTLEVWDRDWPVFNVATQEPIQPDDRRFLGFINDERYAVCCADTQLVEVVDVETKQVVASLNCTIDMRRFPCSMLLSPDGKWLVFGHAGSGHTWDGFEASSASFHNAEVWDWQKSRLGLRFDAGPLHLIFAKNGRRLATWRTTPSEYRLAIFDMEAQTPPFTTSIKQSPRAVTFRNNTTMVEYSSGMLSPDGELFLFGRLNGRENKATMFEVASGSALWEKPFYTGAFSKNGAFVGCRHFDSQDRTAILDPRSGQVLHTFKADFQMGPIVDNETFHHQSLVALYGEQQRKREPWFWERWLEKQWPHWFGESKSCILVANPSTGREYFRCYGNAFEPLLSEDGSTLVVSVPQLWDAEGLLIERRICALDVQPHRAYFWSVTWSVFFGVALLCLRHWRLRRKTALASNGAVQQQSHS